MTMLRTFDSIRPKTLIERSGRSANETKTEPSTIKPDAELASENKLPEGEWVRVAKNEAKSLLSTFTDFDGVYALVHNDQLHLYALDKTTSYNHDMAMALGRFEVRLSKALENNFEDIEVHSMPSSSAPNTVKEATRIL